METKVIKVNPREIKLLEVNARFMTADEFQKLVENVKRDGCLTQLPFCVYNDDWYIVGTYDGNIYGEYLKYDERAITEYNVALEEFKKQFSNGHQQNGPKLVKRLY